MKPVATCADHSPWGDSTPTIQLRDVHLEYRSKSGPVKALDGIDISVGRNAFVSIIGPSGCGKSTLLKLVAGVLRPTRGSVYLYGKDIRQVNLSGKVSFVFQRPLLLPWRTALENVLLPSEVVYKSVSAEHVAVARDVLALTGLAGFENKYPHELSGGMQQRVSIARALSIRPEILLMDEPFGALDEITRENLQEELLRIWQQIQSTILFVTHSVQEAILLSDEVVVLSARPGRVVSRFEVNLPRPRNEEIRREPLFVQMVEEVREILRVAKGGKAP